MDRLPSNIMFDIFSRVPAKLLARSRCVSKVWCEYIDDRYLMTIHDERVREEPIPILYHTHLVSHEIITRSLCFHVLESRQTGAAYHTDVLEPKEGPFLEFLHKKPLSKSSIVRIEFRGSCNGLMYLSQDEDDVVTLLVVVHPLKKECYEIPPLPMGFDRYMFRESCGLGFDNSTNALKMVCVRDNLCTMVHVFGTKSWREIPQIPSYRITGKAVFANGCLHWLVSGIDIKTKDSERLIICFDVDKEEFGLIDPPKRTCDLWREYICMYDHLVDLNGDVGYFCYKTMDVWLLKQKQWVPHCRFTWYPNGGIEVLGCWNKDGDMLIRSGGHGEYWFYVYNLKSNVLHKTNIVVPYNEHPNIFMHPNKLFSIHGIGTNSFPMKKTNLNGSCRRLLTYY